MKPRTVYLSVGLAVVVGLLLYTVLRKRWWVDRIRARWVMNRFVFDEVVGRWIPEVTDYRNDDLGKFSLATLIATWRNGEPGWYRQGEEPPPIPVMPMYQGPLGVPILVT